MATGPAPKPTTRRTALIVARVAAGFTQETLAARMGVERTTVYRWEAGLTVPLPMLRPGLAQLLGLDNEQLAAVLGESGEAAHAVDTNGAAASPGSTPHTATATHTLDDLVTVVAASIALVVTTISGTALPPGNGAGARPTELDRLVEDMKRRGLMPLFEKLAARAAALAAPAPGGLQPLTHRGERDEGCTLQPRGNPTYDQWRTDNNNCYGNAELGD